MKAKYDEIEYGMQFVSSAPQHTNQAFLSLETGEIFLTGESIEDELPEDIDDSDRYVEIPHKNELDLGQTLALRFAQEHLPDDLSKVDQMFGRRGAYARFRDLLEHRGQLERWYEFEDSCTEAALRQWCADSGIELVD